MAAAHFGLFADIFAHDGEREAVAAFTSGGRVENVQRAQHPRRAHGDQIGGAGAGAQGVQFAAHAASSIARLRACRRWATNIARTAGFSPSPFSHGVAVIPAALNSVFQESSSSEAISLMA